MLSESLRQRIEALNRQTLPPAAPAERRRAVAPTVRRPRAGLLAAGGVVANDAGQHLLIRLPIERFWPRGERLVAGRIEHLKNLPSERLTADTAGLVDALPDRAVMLDLETCGLGGAALFLVGLITPVDGRLAIELLFARSYAEEKAVLVSLWERLDRCDALATFNGKSFDWPMVADRSRRHLLHKQRRIAPPRHFDLLHAARRRWRGELPDCKLQTLERFVCRRRRTGDIPGKQVPAAYDAYVRTGRPSEIEAVLHHNALDLVTLLDVALRVAA